MRNTFPNSYGTKVKRLKVVVVYALMVTHLNYGASPTIYEITPDAGHG